MIDRNMITINLIASNMIDRKRIAKYMLDRNIILSCSLITSYFRQVYLKSWACTVKQHQKWGQGNRKRIFGGQGVLTVFLRIYGFKKTEAEYKEFKPRLKFETQLKCIQYFKI